MKPYEDKNCECYQIVKEINAKHPNCDWNCDEACNEWGERSKKLKNNNIEFAPYDDDNYACTCPTCGRYICGWCV